MAPAPSPGRRSMVPGRSRRSAHCCTAAAGGTDAGDTRSDDDRPHSHPLCAQRHRRHISAGHRPHGAGLDSRAVCSRPAATKRGLEPRHHCVCGLPGPGGLRLFGRVCSQRQRLRTGVRAGSGGAGGCAAAGFQRCAYACASSSLAQQPQHGCGIHRVDQVHKISGGNRRNGRSAASECETDSVFFEGRVLPSAPTWYFPLCLTDLGPWGLFEGSMPPDLSIDSLPTSTGTSLASI